MKEGITHKNKGNIDNKKHRAGRSDEKTISYSNNI